MFFDVYETSTIGCTAGHIVYSINFTNVSSVLQALYINATCSGLRAVQCGSLAPFHISPSFFLYALSSRPSPSLLVAFLYTFYLFIRPFLFPAFALVNNKRLNPDVQVEEDDIVVTDNGRQADDQPSKSEKEMLETLNLNPFYVLQDIASGVYINFVSPSTELKMYLDLKRSLFKDLNPVVDAAAETAVGPAGEKLFMHYEHDLNGRHHTTVMLRQDEHGRTETQHIRKMLSSQSLYEEDNQDSVPPGPSSGDNGPCPYPEPNTDEGLSDHKKTATSNNGAVESSEDKSHTKIGEAPNEVQPASEQSERDEEKSGQNPMGSSMEIIAEYQVFRVATSQESGACSSTDGSPAAAVSEAAPAPPALASTPHAQSLLQWRANVERLTATSEGMKDGLQDETEARMVVRPFKTHMLYDQSDEEAERVMLPAQAQATVQHLIEGIGAANKADEKIDTKGMAELRDLCQNHQLRSIMFKWLATPESVNKENKRTVLKFMGSCGAILASSTHKLSRDDIAGNTKNGLLYDLSTLINNDMAPEFVRGAGLQTLVDLECPTTKTLEEVNLLGTKLHGSALGETATLTLGALLRKHRYCHEATPASSSKKTGLKRRSQILASDPASPAGRVLEAALNERLSDAVKRLDTDDAETTLLAMANSASPVHLLAVARSLEANKKMMKSYELRQAVKKCLKSIGQHGGGQAEQDSMEMQQLYDATPSKTTMLSLVDDRADKSVAAGQEKSTSGVWKADFWFTSAKEGEQFTKETTEFAWRQFFLNDFNRVFDANRRKPALVKDATVISLFNPDTFDKYVEKANKATDTFWVGGRWTGQVFFEKKGTYTFRTQTGGGASELTIGTRNVIGFAKSVFQWFTKKDDFAIKNAKTGKVRNFGDWYLGSDDEITDGQTLVSRDVQNFAATFQMCNLYVYKTSAPTEMWKTTLFSDAECKSMVDGLMADNDCQNNPTEPAACTALETIRQRCASRESGLELVLTEDGHLGMYRTEDTERLVPFWIFSSNAQEKLSKYPSTSYFFRAMVKGDGRLVVYAYPSNSKCKRGPAKFDGESEAIWESGEPDDFSDGGADSLDDLQLNTNYLESGFCKSGSSSVSRDTLKSGMAITSQNGIYEVTVVPDGGKLVAKLIGKPLVYRTGVSPNAPGCKGVLTEDGAFKIVKGSVQKFITSTNTNSPAGKDNGPFQLLMQRDGLVVIYNSWKQKVWASGGEKLLHGQEDDSKLVFVSDMEITPMENTVDISNDNTDMQFKLIYGGALDHASLSVEYSGPDTGDVWVALSAYSGGDQTPLGENVDLNTLPAPPPEDEDEDEDEEEDDLDPAKCLGGEDPLVCYGKRIPESGAVRGLLTLDAGKAEAKEAGNGNKCQNYGFIRGEAVAELYTGLPWDGWDPFVVNILELEGRYLMGPKCHCDKIGLNTCPSKKECKAANKLPAVTKKSKADGKKKIGGHFSVFGFVLKKFGKLSLQDPHSDAVGGSLIPEPPSGTVSASGLFKDLNGKLEAVEPPTKNWGFCGFQESEYSVADSETTKQKPIPGINAVGFWVGPVRVGINAYIKMAMGGEIGVTANHQESSQLTNGGEAECKDGGRSGQGTTYVKTVLEISGTVTIVFAKGSLGCDLTFFSAQATGNAELLSGGYGKEAYVGFQAISGEIFAKLSLAEFSYSWWCAARFKRGQQRCYLWLPNISFSWAEVWRKVIWAFKARFDSGNLLCNGLSDVGCAEFEENVGGKLFQILRTVDAFKEAAEKFAHEVMNNEVELTGEQNSLENAEKDEKKAKREYDTSVSDLVDLGQDKTRLEDLIGIETHNIGLWGNHKNSHYYQFSTFDKTRTPGIQCSQRTKEDIEGNDELRQLPEGVEWRAAPRYDVSFVKVNMNKHHKGDKKINSGGVASEYEKGGSARRRLLSSPSETPAASKGMLKKTIDFPASEGSFQVAAPVPPVSSSVAMRCLSGRHLRRLLSTKWLHLTPKVTEIAS